MTILSALVGRRRRKFVLEELDIDMHLNIAQADGRVRCVACGESAIFGVAPDGICVVAMARRRLLAGFYIPSTRPDTIWK
jgi:hypothetical protein